jgi:acyl-CoA thioesterase
MESVPFTESTRLLPVGEGRFEAEPSPIWKVSVGVNGGVVSALMARAAEMSLPADRHLRSLTVHFPRPVMPGKVLIESTIEREGSMVTSLSLRMTQDGQTVALALASAGSERDSFELNDLPMPSVPAPEAIEPIPFIEGMMPNFMSQADFRPAFPGGPGMTSPDGSATVGGWMRPIGGGPLDAASCAFMSDAWWPTVFAIKGEVVGAPTIDLTIHFRAGLPHPRQDDEYVLGRFTSRLVSGGHFEEDGVLWAADGTVLAHSRQLALVLPLLKDAFKHRD